MTTDDQRFMVSCRFDIGTGNVTITNDLSIDAPAITTTNYSIPVSQFDISLTILDSTSQQPIQQAIIGETLFLSIALPNGTLALPRSCRAIGSASETMSLTDDAGCPTQSLFGPFEQRFDGDAMSLVAPFQAFRFRSSMALSLECVVEICRIACSLPMCSGGLPTTTTTTMATTTTTTMPANTTLPPAAINGFSQIRFTDRPSSGGSSLRLPAPIRFTPSRFSARRRRPGSAAPTFSSFSVDSFMRPVDNANLLYGRRRRRTKRQIGAALEYERHLDEGAPSAYQMPMLQHDQRQVVQGRLMLIDRG